MKYDGVDKDCWLFVSATRIDKNSGCTSNVCTCKAGFTGLTLFIPNLTRDARTHICFVEEGNPCQADLLKNMVEDTDNILTVPGAFDKLIEKNKEELEDYLQK